MVTTIPTVDKVFESVDAALPYLHDVDGLAADVYDAPSGVVRVMIAGHIWRIDERQLNEFLIKEFGYTEER
jgi:hypothetical protein